MSIHAIDEPRPRKLNLRLPLPETILVMETSEQVLARITEMVSGRARVLVSTPRKCAPIIRKESELAAIIRVPGATEYGFIQQSLALRREFPNLPWIALFEEGVSSSPMVLQLGQVGVSHLVSAGKEFPESALMATLARCEGEGVAARTWAIAQPSVPEELVTLMKKAMRLAHESTSVTEFALRSGMHERTLRKLCLRKDLPTPQWIIGWARVLIAAFYLDEPGRSVQSISELLKFASAAAFVNHLKRYVGKTPSELRNSGAIVTATRLMENELGISAQATRKVRLRLV